MARSPPIDFRLDAGESREDLVLELRDADRSLSGRVLDTRGNPVALVQVAQGHIGSKERYKKTYTGADGQFTISGLGPGPHRLRFRKKGYQQTRKKNLRATQSDITVILPDAASAQPP